MESNTFELMESAIRQAQAALADYLPPDSNMGKEALINRLLEILDDRDLLVAMNAKRA